MSAEPLPVRRRRVLEDLRRARGKTRQEVAVLAKNVAEILGLDGGLRITPERADYGRIGALSKRFGADHVWTTACRVAGLGIEGDAIAYLQRCLEGEPGPPESVSVETGPTRAKTPAPAATVEQREKGRSPVLPESARRKGLGQLVQGPLPPDPAQPTRSSYIANLITDISLQFGDTEHYRENDAQAHNLWQESGLGEHEFVQQMYKARQTALHLAGARNRMAYFFTVLRDLMRSEAAEAGEDPPVYGRRQK